MKILAVYPYIPYPLNRGAYYRAFHLLRALAESHEVDLIALSEKCEGMAHKEVFQDFCNRVELVPFEHPAWQTLFPKRIFNRLPSTIAHWTMPPVEKEIDALLSSNRYDAVHLCDIVLGQYFLKKHRTIPFVVDRTRVDLQYQLMEHKRLKFSFKQRLLNYENYTKLWFYEKAMARRARVEVVCGPDDESFVRAHVSKRVPIEVIPNGVDLDYFAASDAQEGRDPEPTLIFCGAMDYNPNMDALRWYFAEIHEALRSRIPNLRVLIVGKYPGTEVKSYSAKPGVTVTGGVPDVRPYYKRSWIQMVPLRIGGGTRLKIVESMAMGTPVVSTTIGAQGLGLRHDHDILLADTAKTFVDETVRALSDPSLRARLADTGLRSVRERLSWNKLGGELREIYRKYFSDLNHSEPSATAQNPAYSKSPSR